MEKTELKLGLQPFWFWNGDMKKEEIVSQILEMKAKGIPGFMIHPRQGMEVPYMSKEFFDRVRLAVQTAKENDMEVWLYDEYPYPSGICGGEVILEHPEYCNKHLEKVVRMAAGGERVQLKALWGRVLLARAYRVKQDGSYSLDDYVDLQDYVGTGYKQEVFQYSGLTLYNKKRYFTGDPVKLLDWTAPEVNAGESFKIYFVTEVVTKHFKYFENFIDTLNPDALRYFIELTHERYKKEIGEEFGRTVKGVFTDEITAFPDRQPWSPLLPGEVKKRQGIDLIDNLPALWEDFGELSTRVRYAYWNTATDMFLEAYDMQVQKWCHENGILYIGEKPILRSKQLQYFDVPGIDAGHQKVGSVARMFIGKYRANGKMVASAAHFYDKPAALCEVGHSVGWGMTMQDMKWMFDFLGVLGIDFLTIHGFYYTANALKKHDAPPSPFYQMPWWEDASEIAGYAKKMGQFLQTTKRDAKFLVIDPVTSAWVSDRETETRLKDDFAALQSQLMFHGLDYYIIDPDLFETGEVVKKGGKVWFSIHGDAYETIILPPVRNLEKGTFHKLLEFIREGGAVCGLYTIPFETIAEGCDVEEYSKAFGVDGRECWKAYLEKGTEAEKDCQAGKSCRMGIAYQTEKDCQEKAADCCYLAGSIEEAIDWLSEKALPTWQVTALDGLGREYMPMMCGVSKEGRSRCFLVNSSPKKRKVEIRTPEGRACEMTLLEYESRMMEETEAGILDATSEVLCTAEEKTVKAGKNVENFCVTADSCGKLQEECPDCEIDIRGEMPFTLSAPNALRLGFWELTLPQGQRAVVETAPLIDQLETGKLCYPIVQRNYFGCPKEIDFSATTASFSHKFFVEEGAGAEEPVYLVMEPGTFLGKWSLAVNGTVLTEKDFTEKYIYEKHNLVTEVTSLLHTGENEITASVEVEVSFGGMRNPLYLFGSFGVEKKGDLWHLTEVKKEGSMENLPACGLPFYYGEVVYTTELTLPEDGELWKKEVLRISMEADWLTDSVRLVLDGKETKPCAWKPYVFQVPADWVKPGRNTVQIKVRNTAIGLYEGQFFNREEHQYELVGAQDNAEDLSGQKWETPGSL